MSRLGVLHFVLVLGSSARAQDGHVLPIDGWNGFKPGSWVRFEVDAWPVDETISELGPRDTRSTQRLVGCSDAMCFLNGVDKYLGFGRSIALGRNRAGLVPVDSTARRSCESQRLLGEDSITIGDRCLDCRVWEIEVVQHYCTPAGFEPVAHVVKLWESDEVPGKVVKYDGVATWDSDPWIARLAGYSGQIQSLHERVLVGDREIDCALLVGTAQTTDEYRAWRTMHRRWISDEIPGRVVRSIMEETVDSGWASLPDAPESDPERRVITTTAVAFQVAK